MLPILFTFCILFTFTRSQELQKCSLSDSQCQKDYFQNVAKYKAKIGIPSIGIPVIDPFALKNVVMPILGLYEMTLIEGECDDISKCIVTSYETDVPNRTKRPEMICDPIIIKGRYKLTGVPGLEQLCDFDLHGSGNLTIRLEKWFFKFKYPFKVVRHSDGQIYLKALFEKAVYEAGVTGKVTLEINGLKLGKMDISNYVENFINKNWRLVMFSDIGKFINDKSAIYYYDIYGKFFDRTPASAYLSDDLSSLVEN